MSSSPPCLPAGRSSGRWSEKKLFDDVDKEGGGIARVTVHG